MMVIGTRGSDLALAQANYVSDVLHRHGQANRLKILTTKGDVVQDRFDKMEGKGFFTKEIEDALAAGEIDLAVHSLKDLPTEDPAGLRVAAITQREDPFDVLVSVRPLKRNDQGLPILDGLRIGTSSNRRVAAIRRLNPDAAFVPIRGNVPTRIDKARRGEVDVAVLAQAGINRLNHSDPGLYFTPALPPLMVPAPGQGALALQVRDADRPDLCMFHHGETARCVEAERSILAALEGGCQLPLGVLIRSAGSLYALDLFLGTLREGHHTLSFSLTGESPESLATEALARIRSERP